MVDVHVGIARQPLVEKVDERLERAPLTVAVVRPDRPVAPGSVVARRRVVLRQQAEEEVQPPRRLPERVALDVEDDVARRGSRQPLEALLRLCAQRMPRQGARRAPMQLQPGLIVQRVVRPRRQVGDLRLCRRRRQLGQRADARRPQPRDLIALDAGHQHQVVLAPPPLVAHLAELAQRAVVDRVRLGGRGAAERGEEAAAHASVVGGEVGVAQPPALADAEQHVHRDRCRLLDGGDRLAVEAELQHVRRLLGARQLGVQRLVAPRSQRGRLLDPLEEVRAPAPVAQHERRLVDDLRPRAHGLERGACRALEVPAIRADHVDDLLALRAQRGQMRGLVLLALAPQEIDVILRHVRPRAGAARDLERQRREVRALDVVVEVGGREDQAAVERLHRRKDYLSRPIAARTERPNGSGGGLLRASCGLRGHDLDDVDGARLVVGPRVADRGAPSDQLWSANSRLSFGFH